MLNKGQMGAITGGIDSLQKCECKQIQNIFLFWYQMKLFTSVPLVIPYLTRLSFHLHKLLDLRLKEEWMMPFFTPKKINQFQFRLIILKNLKEIGKQKKKEKRLFITIRIREPQKNSFWAEEILPFHQQYDQQVTLGQRKE